MKRDLSGFHRNAHRRLAKDLFEEMPGMSGMLGKMFKKNWFTILLVALLNIGLIWLLVWGIVKIVTN